MDANNSQTTSCARRSASLPTLAVITFSLALLCSGCLAPRSYVDPLFRRTSYANLKNIESPRRVTVGVEFQLNGKREKQQETIVRRKVIRVLGATRMFEEAESDSAAPAGHLEVTVNNIGNLGSAYGQEFATRMTLGLVSSHVIDGYEMTVVYSRPGGPPKTKKYKHAVHTIVGAQSKPKGMEPVPRADAFDQVVEEMLLCFLRDLQTEGLL